MDRENAIKLLSDCRIKSCAMGLNGAFFTVEVIDSIITLLKEQEAVEPKYNAKTNWYECGNCYYSMTSGMHCRSELIPATKVRYCANCGFPVLWEGG